MILSMNVELLIDLSELKAFIVREPRIVKCIFRRRSDLVFSSGRTFGTLRQKRGQ